MILWIPKAYKATLEQQYNGIFFLSVQGIQDGGGGGGGGGGGEGGGGGGCACAQSSISGRTFHKGRVRISTKISPSEYWIFYTMPL